MDISVFAKMRNFFHQPTSVELEVVRPMELDLEPYHNSIGYLCDEITHVNNPVAKQFNYKGVVAIHAHDGSVDGQTNPFEAVITVIFDEREVTVYEIIDRFKKIGVNTRVFV